MDMPAETYPRVMLTEQFDFWSLRLSQATPLIRICSALLMMYLGRTCGGPNFGLRQHQTQYIQQGKAGRVAANIDAWPPHIYLLCKVNLCIPRLL